MGDFSILAIRIKELRNSMKITQKDFSAFVGCTAATLSAYENGSKSPSLEIIKGIAEKCNVSIDWLCGLSEQKELKPEIKNYKDIALKVLELSSINMFPDEFELKTYKVDATDYESAFPGETKYYEEWGLALPGEHKFLEFISTYKELNKLYKTGRIKQEVINTWLNGALEELKTIPIKAPIEEFDERHSNISDEPP